jgi:hypothetical protein
MRRRLRRQNELNKVMAVLLDNTYIKYNKHNSILDKVKHFISAKSKENFTKLKRRQKLFAHKRLYMYAQRALFIFRILHKFKSHDIQKNYIYKYFNEISKKPFSRKYKTYIATYLKYIYRKTLKFNISKYCKSQIFKHGVTINILTTLRKLLLFKQAKKQLKDNILLYNMNKLS